MIYLASPYSHPLETTRIHRYLHARDFCSLQMSCGVEIFSPICYGHQFAQDLGHGTDALTWKAFNDHMLLAASELWILQLPGWKESIGISNELMTAITYNIPVSYKEPLRYAAV